jgi:hypothetical protein
MPFTERLVGPSNDLVREIISVIKSSPTWQAANERLAQYGIEFTDARQELNQTGAPGGYALDVKKVLLNANTFRRRDTPWDVILNHELVHKEQMDRMMQSGGDPDEVHRSLERRFIARDGTINMANYTQHPFEMQALAKNAVVAAGRHAKHELRRGRLGAYAPLEPGDKKRFGKYAYQMLQAEELADSLIG